VWIFVRLDTLYDNIGAFGVGATLSNPISHTVSQNFTLTTDVANEYLIIPNLPTAGSFRLVLSTIQPSLHHRLQLTPIENNVHTKTLTVRFFLCSRPSNLTQSCFQSSWSDHTAGGSVQFPSWVFNPQFLLSAHDEGEFVIIMSVKSELNVRYGFHIVSVSAATRTTRCFEMKPQTSPGDALTRHEMGRHVFSQGNEVTRSIHLNKGENVIVIPCTFAPGFKSEFQMSVTSFSNQFDLVSLADLNAACSCTVRNSIEAL